MRFASFIGEIYRGKTLARIALNDAISTHCAGISGTVIDIGGGASPSYLRFLPLGAFTRVSADISSGTPIDMNKPLPFPPASFDAVLCFNALYIADDPRSVLSEIGRVLKPGGKLYLSMPFMQGEMPEPHDYARYTQEGLERLLGSAGLAAGTELRIGGRFSSAANLLHGFYVFDTVRLIAYALAKSLDAMTHAVQQRNAAPMLYFIIATK